MSSIQKPALGGAATTQILAEVRKNSVLGRVPEILRETDSTQSMIQRELAAYQRDQKPERLLRVIALQQSLISSHGQHLSAAIAQAAAAFDAVEEASSQLAGLAAAGVQPGGGRPRAAGREPDLPARRLAARVAESAATPTPKTAAMQTLAAPPSMQSLQQTLANLQRSMHNLAMSTVQNLR